MANTERLATIAQVRDAKNAIGGAQLAQGLTDAQRVDLVTLFWKLNDVESKLILQDIKAQIDTLVADSNDMEKIADDMRGKIAELNAVADKVDKAAKAIGVLVKIAELAAQA